MATCRTCRPPATRRCLVPGYQPQLATRGDQVHAVAAALVTLAAGRNQGRLTVDPREVIASGLPQPHLAPHNFADSCPGSLRLAPSPRSPHLRQLPGKGEREGPGTPRSGAFYQKRLAVLGVR